MGKVVIHRPGLGLGGSDGDFWKILVAAPLNEILLCGLTLLSSVVEEVVAALESSRYVRKVFESKVYRTYLETSAELREPPRGDDLDLGADGVEREFCRHVSNGPHGKGQDFRASNSPKRDGIARGARRRGLPRRTWSLPLPVCPFCQYPRVASKNGTTYAAVRHKLAALY